MIAALAQLKSMISHPKLFLINYFNELRRQVDITYANESNETKTWLKMIQLINIFEVECFKNELNKELINQVDQTVKSIESKSFSSENIEQLIEIEELKVKAALFSNKSIIFLPQIISSEEKLKDQESDENSKLNLNKNVFDKKLVKINDECLSNKAIDYLMKRDFGATPNQGDILNQELIKLAQIQLRLSSNEAIMEFSLDLKNQTNLTLANTQFKFKIKADSFGEMDQLKKLIVMQINQIEALEAKVFHLLVNLKELSLIENDISFIDSKAFEGLINLKKLYLTGNNLISINENTFSSLVNLRHLKIDANQLKVVDSFYFSGLLNLEYLDLSANQIETLDKNSFKDLICLKRLALNSNEIKHISSSLEPMANLEELFLNENKIQIIKSNDLKGLFNLINLNLSENEIDSVDSNSFQDLLNLKFLDLSNNVLSSFDDGLFNGLVNLHVLLVSSNKIETINENCLKDLINLKELELDFNQIIEININILKQFTNLRKLRLNNNKLNKTFKYKVVDILPKLKDFKI